MDLERFVRHFGFHVVRVKQDRPRYQIDQYGYRSASYYTDSDRSTIEMEIGHRELESMADYFKHAERMLREDHDEHRLRRDNPALQEAYSKYKMLLELYK